MPNYKKMYFTLFNKVTDVIDELQEIQQKTERLYIESPESKIVLLEQDHDKEDY